METAHLIDLPISEIIDLKIKSHIEAVEFNQRAIFQLERQKELLLGIAPVSTPILPEVQAVAKLKLDFSLPTIKPMVLEFLLTHKGKFTNEQILKGLNLPEWQKNKGNYTAAISNSLTSLVNTKKVKKYDTGARAKLYEGVSF